MLTNFVDMSLTRSAVELREKTQRVQKQIVHLIRLSAESCLLCLVKTPDEAVYDIADMPPGEVRVKVPLGVKAIAEMHDELE